MPTNSAKHQCKFEVCRLRPWFTGFEDAQDLAHHRQFHRCLWLVIDKRTCRTTHCTYVPQDEEDLRAHLKTHLVNDALPRKTFGSVTTWFCPWQTCKSWAFVVKGTPTKSHLTDHIMAHVSALKSKSQRATATKATTAAAVETVTPPVTLDLTRSTIEASCAEDVDMPPPPFGLGSDFNDVLSFELDPDSFELANKLQEEFLQQYLP